MSPFERQPEKRLPVKPDTDFEPSSPPLPASLEEDTPAAREARRILAEEEYQKDLFRRILSGAREQTTSLEELYAQADSLASPSGKDHALSPSTPETDSPWAAALDSDGNPRWITLSVPEPSPEDGRIIPESVLPAPITPATDKSEQQEASSRHKPSGPFQSLLARLNVRPQPTSGKAMPHSRRPRPMRNFFRMLLVTAILGMLYHILAQKGWVPRLF